MSIFKNKVDKYKNKLLVITGILMVSFSNIATAQTQNTQAAKRPYYAFLDAGRISSVPHGWVDFCARETQECNKSFATAKIITLNEKVWAQIVAINDRFNRLVKPVSDMEMWGKQEHWSYPVDNKGDCEDYVLLKKRVLTQAGFPAEAMLITIVRDKDGDGHAVLTLRTDRGDFVLDNQEAEIKLWSQTGYRFLKRQSPLDPNNWLLLSPGQAESVATTR